MPREDRAIVVNLDPWSAWATMPNDDIGTGIDGMMKQCGQEVGGRRIIPVPGGCLVCMNGKHNEVRGLLRRPNRLDDLQKVALIELIGHARFVGDAKHFVAESHAVWIKFRNLPVPPG